MSAGPDSQAYICTVVVLVLIIASISGTSFSLLSFDVKVLFRDQKTRIGKLRTACTNLIYGKKRSTVAEDPSTECGFDAGESIQSIRAINSINAVTSVIGILETA
jgi:hypothetical protein